MDRKFKNLIILTVFCIYLYLFTKRVFDKYQNFIKNINPKIQCNSSDPDIIARFNLSDNTAGFSLVEKELKIAESMKALWPNDSNYPPRNWIEQIRVYLTYSQIQYCKPLVQLIAASSNM